MPRTLIIPAIRKFNPLLDTQNWNIVHEGPKHELGQRWRLTLNRLCLDQLEKDKFLVRLGVGKVFVKPTQKDESQEDVEDTTDKSSTQ